VVAFGSDPPSSGSRLGGPVRHSATSCRPTKSGSFLMISWARPLAVPEVVGGDRAQDFAGRLGEGADAFRLDRRGQIGPEVDVAGHHLHFGRRRRGLRRLRLSRSRRQSAPRPPANAAPRSTGAARRGRRWAWFKTSPPVDGPAGPVLRGPPASLPVPNLAARKSSRTPLESPQKICHTAT